MNVHAPALANIHQFDDATSAFAGDVVEVVDVESATTASADFGLLLSPGRRTAPKVPGIARMETMSILTMFRLLMSHLLRV